MSTTSFSTPKNQKANPHPYAIKTTSTALLSRNSSSSSSTTSTHHYVPPSPSPSPTQTGFGGGEQGERRYARHRYSASESPRPLPAPPSAAIRGYKNNDDDEDDTPRRAQRAYSLPQEIKLPEDPKRWTPAEVSIYLSSRFNGATGRGHDLPTPVAHDLATFVKDKKFTGKAFLRLNEADLEQYGINQLWRATLLDASRALRRNVLRGRIWGNPTDCDNEYDGDNNLSSNSNSGITNRKRSLSTTSETGGRVRDMIDTLERSSSASSSELDEEGSCTDSRRIKDASSKRDKVHHYRHRSLEQHQQHQLQLQQQGGRLPQRGSVSNLFGASGPGPDTTPASEQEIEDKDSTITAHARRNVNGNEPRLLPFPPTGPRTPNPMSTHHYAHIVTPSHTGTSHSLPPSPLDHTRPTPYLNHVLNAQPIHHQPFIFPSHSQHAHTPNAFDYYELGFKNSLPLSPPPPLIGPPIRSPNSQRYVVQHNNNVQPSSLPSTPGGVGVTGHSTGGGGSKGRLLPYPPIVGEAELFHPRPRMGVGVGGLAGELEDGLNEGDESAVYLSAPETQTESADSEGFRGDEEGSATTSSSFEETPDGSGNEIAGGNGIVAEVGSNATDEVERLEKAVEGRGGEEEEPSIQDLLLAQSHTRPRTISGVEAWEMELGETVKRISSNDNSSAASAADGSAGSMSISAGGTKTRTRPRKRDLMMGEIGRKSGRMSGKMNEVDGSLEGGSKKMVVKTTGAGSVLDPELFAPPDSATSGADVDKGLEASSTLSLDSTASASTSTSAQSALDERESSIAERESAIIVLESSLSVRESSITERESLIPKRESSLTDRESALDTRESSITSRESIIAAAEHESALAARESAAILSADKSEIQRRMGEAERREVDVEIREREVEKREREVAERDMRVERREVEVKEWYQEKLNEIERASVDVPPPPPSTPASIPTSTLASTSASSLTSTCTCASKPEWPPSPMEFARRLCAAFLLPVLGEGRTPGFLVPVNASLNSSSTSVSASTPTSITTTAPPLTTTTKPKAPPVPFWSALIKREFFSLNRLLGATAGSGYAVLISIGMCVVVLLRGFVGRGLGVWRR